MSGDAAVPGDEAPARRAHFGKPEWMLLLATTVWGTSFALAKDAGEAINGAAGVQQHLLGPVLVLAMRFTIAAALLVIFVPAARQGWTRSRLRDALLTGVLAALGMGSLNIALDHTTEAIAAFLGSCAVLFVPIILWLFFRQKPAAATFLGIALAVPGVYLMSFGEGDAVGSSVRINLGVWLAMGSAVILAGHLIAVGRLSPRVGAIRMCVGQFAVIGLACWAIVPLCAMRLTHFDFAVFHGPRVWVDLALLIALPTFISFGLQSRYQPFVSPVRAVMIYLFEPVAAAIFAWFWTGRSMTGAMIAGAALVLLANAIVELLPVVKSRRGAERAEDAV